MLLLLLRLRRLRRLLKGRRKAVHEIPHGIVDVDRVHSCY
jgi:hypothetical protein